VVKYKGLFIAHKINIFKLVLAFQISKIQ